MTTLIEYSNQEKRPKSEKIVRFQDCDPLGHLNNAKYIHYIMNAREDNLISYYGENLYEMAKKSNGAWVVAKNEISYIYPALANEYIQIETALIHVEKKSIVKEGIIYDRNRTHIKAVSRVHFSFVNLQGRPVSHSEELQKFLESIWDKEASYKESNFNERISILRKMIKEEKRNRNAA